MRHAIVICSRCRSPVRGFSTIEATAGPIRSCIYGPLELCPDCADRFLEWLRSGYPATQVIASVPTKGMSGRLPAAV
jgi:hypothetical protein